MLIKWSIDKFQLKLDDNNNFIKNYTTIHEYSTRVVAYKIKHGFWKIIREEKELLLLCIDKKKKWFNIVLKNVQPSNKLINLSWTIIALSIKVNVKKIKIIYI